MRLPYGPKPDGPTKFSLSYLALIGAIPAAVLLAWLALPDSPVTVVILAIAVLAAVFAGIGGLLTRVRGLQRAPGRHPRPLPGGGEEQPKRPG